MKSCLRKVDELGRFVLPIDFRRSAGIENGAMVAITVDEGRITVEPAERYCQVCHRRIADSAQSITLDCGKVCMSCAAAVSERYLTGAQGH